MSEQLLKVIIQLLAIVAVEDEVTKDERDTIEDFLRENLGKAEVDKYMLLFDNVSKSLQERITNKDFDEKNEITLLTNQVNQELTQQQKIVIIMELVKLVIADGNITDREIELVYFMGESFNFSAKVIDHIKMYVLQDHQEKLDADNILIVNGQKNNDNANSKHIYRNHLTGLFAFFRIPSLEVYFVKYTGTNSVFLNSIPLKKDSIVIFSSGSTLRSTNIDPIYYSDIVSTFREDNTDSKISFVAENIMFKFPNGKIGLQNINIAEDSGRLIGLMGGSGAGKSTLLNVLNGNDITTEGSVRINNIDINKDRDKIEGVIGYVPQDDLMIEELTVYQNLYYAAKLCFKDANEEKLDELVKKTLSALGLTETSDLKVGSPLEKTISGGQRKRLNIGLELLREPSVMFVDEPTSGLSSRDSENIMDLLKELSLKGKMIFVVIHQPSSDIFKMFDKLVILDVGGYQIYYGNPVEAVTYFKGIVDMIDKEQGSCIECGNVNPEQIFNIIETKVVNEYGQLTDQRKISPVEWNQQFNDSHTIVPVQEADVPPTKTLNIPNKLKQLSIFIKRDVVAKVSDKQYLIINFFEAPVLALALAFIIRYTPAGESAYIFKENPNIPAFFFMSIIVALFMGLTVSAEEIIKDRTILKRESFLNLSRLSYLVSKMVILFTLSAVQTLLFVWIGDALLGVNGMTLPFWIVLFSISCFANILGLNVSSAFNSAVTIYILIPLLIIPQLILSGVVVNFDKLNPLLSDDSNNVPIIGEMMASRWAYEALAVTQYKDNAYETNFFEFDQVIANSEYKTVYYFPELQTSLEYASKHYGETENETLLNHLELLTNELTKEIEVHNVPSSKFEDINNLNVSAFNKEVYESTETFMAILVKIYNKKSKAALKSKNSLLKEMTNSEEKLAEFNTLKNSNENETIAFFLKNTAVDRRIVNINNELVQKIYPIYKIPSSNHAMDFRTHFYAPVKYFGGKFYDTLSFNVVIIWLMSIILMFTLYFDVFRKIVNGFGK